MSLVAIADYVSQINWGSLITHSYLSLCTVTLKCHLVHENEARQVPALIQNAAAIMAVIHKVTKLLQHVLFTAIATSWKLNGENSEVATIFTWSFNQIKVKFLDVRGGLLAIEILGCDTLHQKKKKKKTSL